MVLHQRKCRSTGSYCGCTYFIDKARVSAYHCIVYNCASHLIVPVNVVFFFFSIEPLVYVVYLILFTIAFLFRVCLFLYSVDPGNNGTPQRRPPSY